MYTAKMVVIDGVAWRYWYRDGAFVRREPMIEGADPRGGREER